MAKGLMRYASYATASVSFADAAGRTIGSVDYGREDVGANSAWTHYVFDGTSGDLIDTDSDGVPDVVQDGLPEPYNGTNGSAAGIDFQLQLTEYNAAGQAYRTIDNIGRINETQSDMLGRTLRTIQNYVPSGLDTNGLPLETSTDEDLTTDYQYDAAGRMVTLIAYNPKGTGNGVEAQATKYIYESPVNASWQTAAVYPDSTDVLAQDSSGDWSITTDNGDHTSTAYDLLGRTTTTTDQRGVVHQYDFDAAGRFSADRVTSLGASGIVDGSIRRIATTYDDLGRIQHVTSYDAETGGNVVNDVRYAYDGWGNLAQEWQAHTGAVDTATTPSVEYTYDDGVTSGVAKYNRLAAVTYPNGRKVSYDYSGAVDDIMSRLSAIFDDADSDGAIDSTEDVYAAYRYLGAGTVVVEDYVASHTKLTYLDSGGDIVWLDRFGRVADQVWEHYYLDGSGNEIADDTPDSYAYGYDRAGNRVWKENLTAAEQTPAVHLDELYAYNGLDELIGAQRGQLNSTHDAIVTGTENFSQDWNLDGLGNWSGLEEDSDGDGTLDLDQTRTANAANETTAASGWATPTYDAAGNMTTVPVPQSADADHAIACTYDAWNHLVQATDGGIVVAKYAYDGTGRRILQIVDSQSPGSPDGLDKSIDYYQSGQQVVETREGGLASGVPAAPETLDPTHQFIWSQRYIDALVCRDDYSGGVIQPASRIFYLSDANYNVTALVGNVSGTWQAVERYVYAPYGNPTIYTPDWLTLRAVSSYGNTTLYTGREFDPATGLMYYRARYYSMDLGRFVGRDPIGYLGGINLYVYCGNEPVSRTDPLGEQFAPFGPLSWLLKPYTMAVKKALSGGIKKAGDVGIRTRIQLDMAFGKVSGRFSDMPPRTTASIYGFDTNGPEDELKKIANSAVATVTYQLRLVVRWWDRKPPICQVDYSVSLWCDLTITPKTPPGPAITQSDLWFTVMEHFDY